ACAASATSLLPPPRSPTSTARDRPALRIPWWNSVTGSPRPAVKPPEASPMPDAQGSGDGGQGMGKTQPPQLYAGIDVGTNTVKMIIADLAGGGARRVFDQSVTTRLGEGMQAQGNRMREIPMRRTLDAIADFVAEGRKQNARQIVAVGTAALRDA